MAESFTMSVPFSFELQLLKVELGQQVEAGAILCYLANHPPARNWSFYSHCR